MKGIERADDVVRVHVVADLLARIHAGALSAASFNVAYATLSSISPSMSAIIA
jgi:hypothetical protein